MDMAKGCFPVLIGRVLGAPPEILAATAFAAVLGHVFPVFLKFRGGKGVATALGAFIALAPIATVTSAAVFIGLVLWKRYVSLSSVVGVASFPIWSYVFGQMGWMTIAWLPVSVAGVATAVVVLIRHRANLQRIRAGVESRIGENLEVEEHCAK
jgi:glycerol-3-phosphate acyltransferase PlsY